MIDFRYHLVSLISVFLALAVGVVLGAGPLQNSIGTALQDQVSQLRTDRDAVRAELDATRQQATRSDAFVQAMGPAVVDGTLQGRRIAVVVVSGAQDEDVEAVSQSLVAAGGEVTGRVTLTDAWVAGDRLQYRTTLAGQMLGYLAPAPAADAGTDGVLGTALAQALTRPAPADPAQDPAAAPAPDENAATLLSMLAGGNTPLLEVTQAPTVAAEGVVVVGLREDAAEASAQEPTPTASATAEAEVRRAALLSTVRALDAGVAGTAVVGAAEPPTGLVARIRDDATLAGQISTVDSLGTSPAPITTALALSVDLRGTVGHYGFAPSASAIAPQVAPAEEAR